MDILSRPAVLIPKTLTSQKFFQNELVTFICNLPY